MILLPKTTYEVRETKNRGRGLFATQEIAAGTVLGDYLGIFIKSAEAAFNEKDDGLYLMYYNDQASLYPEDVTAEGMHLFNHSCLPNAWFYSFQGHTLAFALRKIFPGEEITLHYLLSPADYCQPCTHQCFCGSFNCTGSMHLEEEPYKAWRRFSSQQTKGVKKPRARIGETLKSLPTYPTEIVDQDIYKLFGALEKPSLEIENLPTISEARKLIRESGKTLYVKDLKKQILGVEDGSFCFA